MVDRSKYDTLEDAWRAAIVEEAASRSPRVGEKSFVYGDPSTVDELIVAGGCGNPTPRITDTYYAVATRRPLFCKNDGDSYTRLWAAWLCAFSDARSSGEPHYVSNGPAKGSYVIEEGRIPLKDKDLLLDPEECVEQEFDAWFFWDESYDNNFTPALRCVMSAMYETGEGHAIIPTAKTHGTPWSFIVVKDPGLPLPIYPNTTAKSPDRDGTE